MKTMKKPRIILLLALILCSCFSQAQEVVKTKDKLYKKSVKKKTKELAKKGYTAKGAGSIELYITKAINIEFEKDEDGDTKNAVVYTSAVAPDFQNAVQACRVDARAALAGQIETRVAEHVKRSLNLDQISAKSANAINKTITAGKQVIAGKVSTEDIYIFYREIKDENDKKTLIEVEFAVYYSNKLAMIKAKEYIREDLKDEAEELHKDLDKLFNF